jgi:hypothetical protein
LLLLLMLCPIQKLLLFLSALPMSLWCPYCALLGALGPLLSALLLLFELLLLLMLVLLCQAHELLLHASALPLLRLSLLLQLQLLLMLMTTITMLCSVQVLLLFAHALPLFKLSLLLSSQDLNCCVVVWVRGQAWVVNPEHLQHTSTTSTTSETDWGLVMYVVQQQHQVCLGGRSGLGSGR